MPELRDDERRALEELLPFYANDTLPEDERRRVESALEQDDALRAELDFLRVVHGGVKRASDPGSPGELGLRRLMRDVHRERRRTTMRTVWRPLLAIAATLVILTQAVVIARLLDNGRDDPGLRPLGESVPVLQVQFVPEAPEHAIRELLLEIHAVVVDGPSVMGVYRLTAYDLDLALRRLGERPDVVSHVARE